MEAEAKVAVTSRSFSRHPVLRDELLKRYRNVRFNDSGVSLTGEELFRFLDGADMAIVALERIDAALLERLPDLKVISKYGVGLDMIDLQSMLQRGISLGWQPGVNALSVAELTIQAMIALLHRVPEGAALVSQGEWRQLRGRQLTGKTVGIIGCGHVGKEVVKLLAPFACKVLANDIRDYPSFYKEWNVEPVSLELLLRESDVVTLHVPLDDSTADIMNAKRLGMMKSGSLLINNARGGLLDEAAVLKCLNQNTLGGAAFDVVRDESAIVSNLAGHPRVLVTPHIGGSAEEAVLAMGRAAIDGLGFARLVDEYDEFKTSEDKRRR